MVHKLLCASVSLAIALFTGCTSAERHAQSVQDSGDRLTVGKVQREIRVGMSGAEVIEVLGSPNIVSTDENRQEVWVYDKISTDTVYSTSSGGVGVLVFGVVGSAGAKSVNQRTLTVIVKFDDQSRVRDFAYHTSSF